jgi:cell division septum initiation protein DivIVA
MAYDHDGGMPFTIVRKGYDKDEVRRYFDRFDTELRVTATDRDAAAAQARDLAHQLEDARDEIDSLRKDVDRLSVPPTTAEGMSERISRMLRLASDESSEVRAKAQSDAAEMISIAEQEATALRGKYEAKLAETNDRRSAMDTEHEQTMARARTEAARMIEAAQSEAARLEAESDAKRASIQQDFEITMSERRTKVVAAVDELEASSKAEAERRLTDATNEARRRLQTATEQADKRIAHAKELAEELRVLRGRILAQLLGIRGQLDSVPAMLASVNREGELLDGKADSQRGRDTDHVEDDLDSDESDLADLEHADSEFSDDESDTEQVTTNAG